MDSAWIAYNKPKSPELANEYAGFLMALGLNGHLTKLATLNIHDYLTKVHSPSPKGTHTLGVAKINDFFYSQTHKNTEADLLWV